MANWIRYAGSTLDNWLICVHTHQHNAFAWIPVNFQLWSWDVDSMFPWKNWMLLPIPYETQGNVLCAVVLSIAHQFVGECSMGYGGLQPLLLSHPGPLLPRTLAMHSPIILNTSWCSTNFSMKKVTCWNGRFCFVWCIGFFCLFVLRWGFVWFFFFWLLLFFKLIFTYGACKLVGSIPHWITLWEHWITLWEQRPPTGFVSFILGITEMGVWMEKDMWFPQGSQLPLVCRDCCGGHSTLTTVTLLHAWSDLAGLCMVILFMWLYPQSV